MNMIMGSLPTGYIAYAKYCDLKRRLIQHELTLAAIRTVVEGELAYTDTAILVKRILDEGETK